MNLGSQLKLEHECVSTLNCSLFIRRTACSLWLAAVLSENLKIWIVAKSELTKSKHFLSQTLQSEKL